MHHPTIQGAPAPHAGGLATCAEAQRFLSLSRTTLYYLSQRGTLTPVRIGRALRFRWADLQRLAQGGEE